MYTLGEIRRRNFIIFESKMGSHAYGTATPESDTDIRGVFIQPIEDIIKYGYVEQISDSSNDTVFYELKRFLDLVRGNNPNILELLYAPKDCVIQKSPAFDEILKYRDFFITKKCKNTFSGYAIQQIKKARGYNKKINWENEKIARKGVLDFCYVLNMGDSISLSEYLRDWKANMDQKDFALAKIDHAHNIYGMYYLPNSGILSSEDSNNIKLSSIPKEAPLIKYLIFNKDAYSTHCKEYSEYQQWIKNRNQNRFLMNKAHGKNYDSKNMMHCVRLLTMGIEIAEGKGVIVRRPEYHRKILMSIRNGEMEFDKLMEIAESLKESLDEKYQKSYLPDDIDPQLIPNILYEIRNFIK